MDNPYLLQIEKSTSSAYPSCVGCSTEDKCLCQVIATFAERIRDYHKSINASSLVEIGAVKLLSPNTSRRKESALVNLN
jgi:hypothetical protein